MIADSGWPKLKFRLIFKITPLAARMPSRSGTAEESASAVAAAAAAVVVVTVTVAVAAVAATATQVAGASHLITIT